LTKDQQAKAMMDKGEFKQAKETFLRDDWQAVSAYRAKDYEQAGKKFQSLDGEEASYNQGNALAQMKQYKKAISAYNNTLRINPEHKDALHNRKIVEDLLKKEQEQKSQDRQDQDKQDQDKQDQDKQDQDKQDQDKQDQDKQDQDKQDQDKQDQDKQDQDKQDQDKQDQDKQDQDKQDQDKQDQDKKDQDKQDQDKKDQSNGDAAQAARENQQAKDQWLRLIPDDPGGLLREKFRRDHLRRQQGWGR
jgi:Ca-activated chloride channel family protein